MAVSNLVPFTEGGDQSSPQEVAGGAVHTLIPITKGGGGGKVVVNLVNADDGLMPVATLTTRSDNWQIQGPATYVVAVRNAGCDVST